jgi:hypothetical protein
VQPAAVRQPGVRGGVGLVQPPPGGGDGAGGERAQLCLAREPAGDRLLDPAGADHEGALMPVDHDLLDVVLGQVAFQRAKAQQGVEHRLLDLVLLGSAERRPAGEHVLTVGVLQPLGDHRPHLRLVVAGRGVQPLGAEPAGQLGGGCGPHPRDQPLGDAGPVGMRAGHVDTSCLTGIEG